MKKQEIEVPIEIIGKPRMTRADQWRKRKCVLKYRQWADSLRELSPEINIKKPSMVKIYADIPMPDSWNNYRKSIKHGTLHDQKPDVDNCIKSILDVLFDEDKSIGMCFYHAKWCNRGDEKITITIWGD